MNPETKQS